jgi:hypothetical protein
VISSAGNPSRGGKPVISAVLFDMNEVLCRYDREARIACLARVCAKAPSFVEAAIWRSGYEDLADSGAMDAEAYLSGFGERLGCALTRKQWIAALRAAVTPIPEALALAARIAREARVAVLTNNNLLVAREEAYPVDSGCPTCCVLSGRNRAVSGTPFDGQRSFAFPVPEGVL